MPTTNSWNAKVASPFTVQINGKRIDDVKPDFPANTSNLHIITLTCLGTWLFPALKKTFLFFCFYFFEELAADCREGCFSIGLRVWLPHRTTPLLLHHHPTPMLLDSTRPMNSFPLLQAFFLRFSCGQQDIQYFHCNLCTSSFVYKAKPKKFCVQLHREDAQRLKSATNSDGHTRECQAESVISVLSNIVVSETHSTEFQSKHCWTIHQASKHITVIVVKHRTKSKYPFEPN